jgi:tetratricopeptide (TPR) repeat protein/membrane protease YdiL (CAAX protease family)
MPTNSDDSVPPILPSDDAAVRSAPSAVPEPLASPLEDPITEKVFPKWPFDEALPAEDSPSLQPAEMPAEPSLPSPGLGGALGWCFLLCIYAGFAAVPCVFLLKLVMPDKPRLVFRFVTTSLSTCLASLGMVSKTYGRNRRRRLAVRRLSPFHLTLILLMAPPLLLVASEIANCATLILDPERRSVNADEHAVDRAPELRAALGTYSDWSEKMYREMAKESWWLILVAGCLLPAIGEEAFCRGFLGRGLVARHGLVVGILLTSLLFGFLHVNPVQICTTSVLGVFLHSVYLTTRTYWAPVVLHALHNSLVFLALRLGESVSLDVTGQYEKAHLPPLSVAAAGAMLLGLVFLLHRTRTRWLREDGQEWSPGYISAEMPPAELAATARRASPGKAPACAFGIAYFAFALVALFAAYPDNAHTAWSRLARADQHLERKEFDAAIRAYTEAIDLDATNPLAYYNRGVALMNQERHVEALPDFTQAIRLDANLTDAYFNRAVCYYCLQQHEPAIADYSQFLSRKPDDVQAHYNRGLIYFGKGADDQAIADFTWILQREPANVDACFHRGHAYLLKNQWGEAVRDFTTAIQLDPRRAEAFYLRSFARELQGDKKGAESDRRQALAIDPDIAEKFR